MRKSVEADNTEIPSTPTSDVSFLSPRRNVMSLPELPILCSPSPRPCIVRTDSSLASTYRIRKNSEDGDDLYSSPLCRQFSCTDAIGRDIEDNYDVHDDDDDDDSYCAATPPTPLPRSFNGGISQAPFSYSSKQRSLPAAPILIEASPSPLKRMFRLGSSGQPSGKRGSRDQKPINQDYLQSPGTPSSVRQRLMAPLAPLLHMVPPLHSPRRQPRPRIRNQSMASASSSLPDLSTTEADFSSGSMKDQLATSSFDLAKTNAQDRVHKLSNMVTAQQQRKGVLRDLIAQEKNLAKARYLHGNETGALLAMKKVHRMEQEKTRVGDALMTAEEALANMEEALHQACTPFHADLDKTSIFHEIERILAREGSVVVDKKDLRRKVMEL